MAGRPLATLCIVLLVLVLASELPQHAAATRTHALAAVNGDTCYKDCFHRCQDCKREDGGYGAYHSCPGSAPMPQGCS